MAQEQNKQTAATKKPSLDKMQQSFFSQLRSLCKHVEGGIQELYGTGISHSEDSVNARNMFLHTAKELKELKLQTQAEYQDFAVQSARLSHIQDIMRSLVQVYTQRLENVESFIEKYGYVRPDHPQIENTGKDGLTKGKTKTKPETSGVEEVSGQKISDSGTDSEEFIAGDDDDDGDGVKTPPTKSEAAKARHLNLLLTPKFEDFCIDTTEATLALLDECRSVNYKSHSAVKGKKSKTETEHLSTQKIPDSPAPLKSSKTGNTSTFTNVAEEKLRKGPHLSTPETPEHVRTVFGSVKKSKADTTLAATGLFSTPETPENIRTIIMSSTKKPPPLPKSTPMGSNLFSTPDTPENIRTIIGSMKKTKPDTHAIQVPPGLAHLSTPKTPEHVRTIISSLQKPKPPKVTTISNFADLDKIEPPTRNFTDHNVFTDNPPTYAKSKLATPETPENVRRILSTMNGAMPAHERKFPDEPQEMKAHEHSKPYSKLPVSRPVKRNILSTTEAPSCVSKTLRPKHNV
ncbi:hypothetical protein EGW08_013337 [Elysia chlorotica]|uniref:Spindle and kinetochore-associated protein 3 n=1 Tax=Elysia chlorotica TaxID=188477 RepID=A0A3S1BZG3_ELYCH|nr:hypothetical protein EGW08_013337 [Elysia chlorotica]